MSKDFNETRPIGEVFIDEDGVRLKVVAAPTCSGCYYANTPNCFICESKGNCSYDNRTDNTSVIFVEVKGGQQ